ncbi:unnamed protein product, partial [Adineta steineri]
MNASSYEQNEIGEIHIG